MVERLYVERGRKSAAVHGAVCSHEQQTRMLFTRRKEGRVVEMNEIQVMTAVSLLALVSNKLNILFLRKSFAMQVWREHVESLESWMNEEDCM